jgi:hypothetical protein
MGCIALGLMLLAEFSVVLWVRGADLMWSESTGRYYAVEHEVNHDVKVLSEPCLVVRVGEHSTCAYPIPQQSAAVGAPLLSGGKP